MHAPAPRGFCSAICYRHKSHKAEPRQSYLMSPSRQPRLRLPRKQQHPWMRIVDKSGPNRSVWLRTRKRLSRNLLNLRERKAATTNDAAVEIDLAVRQNKNRELL